MGGSFIGFYKYSGDCEAKIGYRGRRWTISRTNGGEAQGCKIVNNFESAERFTA